MYEVIKRELVSADIAMHADLSELRDEDALRWHVARIVDGERCAIALLDMPAIAALRTDDVCMPPQYLTLQGKCVRVTCACGAGPVYLCPGRQR